MTQLPIFDGHNDTLTNLYLPERGGGRSFFERSEEGHLDLPRAREGGLLGGFFAIFAPAPPGSPEREQRYGLTISEGGYELKPRSPVDHEYAKEFTDEVIQFLHQLLEQGDGAIGLVTAYGDLERNMEEGILSVVLHLEDAAAIHEDLSNLEQYYAAGVRSLGLVWSRPNAFGEGVPFRFPHSPDTGPGLTEAGRRLITECNRLGVMIDLAHINERGFWDVAELSVAPLVVSHAGVHALCPSTRNLTDEQIDAVGESNGLVGIIFAPGMIRADGQREEDAPLTDIVGHIAYVIERIGVDCVALGSDFDGARMPSALADVAHLPNLTQALRARGYDRDALEKIAYRNWYRIARDSWKPA